MPEVDHGLKLLDPGRLPAVEPAQLAVPRGIQRLGRVKRRRKAVVVAGDVRAPSGPTLSRPTAIPPSATAAAAAARMLITVAFLAVLGRYLEKVLWRGGAGFGKMGKMGTSVFAAPPPIIPARDPL